MSPVAALLVVTWAAIVVLFFGLAAVLREVRLLRGIVTRDRDGFVAAQPELSLGEPFTGGDGTRIVLAVDSGCPLCLAATQRLAARGYPATLLTHESPEAWPGIAGGLTVVSDRESWRSISHLSPPVLMLVDGSGRVRRMVLPVREQEVDHVLDEWRIPGVTDVRSDS
jgi:hypothetical protein